MAHAEGVTESVEAVQFSFMTDEDIRKHSVVRVTNPNLLDSVGRPLPGGLYEIDFHVQLSTFQKTPQMGNLANL